MEKTENIYQIKVKLKGITPTIWRRFQIPGNVSLLRLHLVLQKIMGWQNYHLFGFHVNDIRFAIPVQDDYYKTKDARRYKIYKVITQEKVKFLYIYDFGDRWEHELTVEKIIPSKEILEHPVCLAGKRAGPPEDSGGVESYKELLKVLSIPLPENADEEDKEIRSMREWLGEDFDPEHFDIEEINRKLAKMKLK